MRWRIAVLPVWPESATACSVASGHALTIDSGWREVADIALRFVQRFVAPDGAPARAEAGEATGS